MLFKKRVKRTGQVKSSIFKTVIRIDTSKNITRTMAPSTFGSLRNSDIPERLNELDISGA